MRKKASWTNRIGNAIDTVIETVAPGVAMQREQIRFQKQLQERMFDHMERYFDGADNSSRLRADRWLASKLSPDSALEQDLDELREHAKELYRSFGYITGAIDHRTDNVVGTGLTPKAWIRAVPGVISETDAKRWNAELDDLFLRWAPNAGGPRRSWTSLLRLGHRTWRMAGDSFFVLSDKGGADKPIPLQIDVISPERVETPPGKAASPRVRLGIEKDSDGQVMRYWIRETHPDDSLDNRQIYREYGIDRVCHLFDELFPGQSRGLPWTFAITSDARDAADYKEAVIIAAQVAACQTMIVQSSNPQAMAQNGLNANGQLELEPGKVLYTGLGDTVSAFNPTQPQTTYGMFSEWNLLGIAAGLNYPFGWLVKDRRKATFSAGRLEEIDGGVPLRADFVQLRDCVVMPVWKRFVKEALIVGETSIPIELYRIVPHLFDRCKVAPNGRPWVDPVKEVTSAILAKEHNIDTLEAIQARLGKDVVETFETRAEERRRETELGIVAPIYSGQMPANSADDDSSDPANDDSVDANTDPEEATT